MEEFDVGLVKLKNGFDILEAKTLPVCLYVGNKKGDFRDLNLIAAGYGKTIPEDPYHQENTPQGRQAFGDLPSNEPPVVSSFPEKAWPFRIAI